jgi:hypothetical protein
MDDRECVLRHLAFRITPFERYSKPDLNDFLGNAMQVINEAGEEYISSLVSGFVRSMEVCHLIFDQFAFRKFNRQQHSRGPVNKALFETWSTAVLDYDPLALEASADAIRSGLEAALVNDADYLKSLSLATGGLNPVRKRFNKAHQIIRAAVSQ